EVPDQVVRGREVFLAVVLEEEPVVVAQQGIPVPAQVFFGVGVAGVDLVVGNQGAVAGKGFEERSGGTAGFEDLVIPAGLFHEVTELQPGRTGADNQVIELQSVINHWVSPKVNASAWFVWGTSHPRSGRRGPHRAVMPVQGEARAVQAGRLNQSDCVTGGWAYLCKDINR